MHRSTRARRVRACISLLLPLALVAVVALAGCGAATHSSAGAGADIPYVVPFAPRGTEFDDPPAVRERIGAEQRHAMALMRAARGTPDGRAGCVRGTRPGFAPWGPP